ncbi:hypothetical protein WUBG_09115, partial [Wuchereria bancrofti]
MSTTQFCASCAKTYDIKTSEKGETTDRLPYSLVCSPLAFPWFVVVRVSKVQERVHKAAEGISKGTQLTQDKISNDKVEGQIQVDRKRLESMITDLKISNFE